MGGNLTVKVHCRLGSGKENHIKERKPKKTMRRTIYRMFTGYFDYCCYEAGLSPPNGVD
jgi:hypothetical protein